MGLDLVSSVSGPPDAENGRDPYCAYLQKKGLLTGVARDQLRRLRDWTNVLLELRRDNSNLQGPAPLDVKYAQDGQLAFTRGGSGEYFVLLNFSSWSGWKSLGELNLPPGLYRERWNSTWPAFQVEWEDEHANGGRDAWLHAGNNLNVPDYGAVILERR